MGALAFLGAVVAICLTVIFVVWLERRATSRRKERARISKILMYRGLALEQIEAEVDLQLQTNAAYHDVSLVKNVLTQYRRDIASLDN